MLAQVLILGSANMDLVLNVGRLPAPGETVMGDGYFQNLGGKGANQAVAAARAGACVRFVARVGEDAFGRDALAAYRDEGIDAENVLQIKKAPTGTALIFVGPEGQNMIGVHSGANAALDRAAVAGLGEELFESAHVFAAQLETPLEALAEAFVRARAAGCITILNPAPFHPDLLDSGILSNVDIIIPNETEAELIIGKQVRASAGEEGEMIAAAGATQRLLDLGCRAAIITLGKDGCHVASGELFEGEGSEGERIVGFAVGADDAVDAVGAGDCFCGAFAARLAELAADSAEQGAGGEHAELIHADLLRAARFANAAASISVTRPGAQTSMPKRAEIDERLSNAG